MQNRFNLILVAALGLAMAACGGSSSGGDIDGGGGGGDDASTGPCPTECSDGYVCRYLNCVPTPPPCTGNDDCEADTYCDSSASECLPWGVGPGGNKDDSCTRDVVAGVFFPEAQCEWLGPPAGDPYPDHTNVLGSPVVIDFKSAGDPELGRPSIVFISYNFTDGGVDACRGDNAAHTGVIRVLDGRSCEQQASIAAPLPIPSTSLAVGDITGDGVPEIVAARVGGGLAAWERNATGGFDMLWETTASSFGSTVCNWAGPSLHDLDDDGVPEILLHGAVYDAAGNELDTGLGILTTDLTTGYVPVVADVDRDDLPELVTGSAYYSFNTTTKRWVIEGALGPTNANVAVADFGTFGMNPGDDDRTTLDGVAEVVTVGQSTVRLLTLGGREIYSAPVPAGGSGGPPTIADFDGDGRAEFAAAGGSAYSVFDLDCLGAPDVTTCASLSSDGVLWSRASQDLSSNKTGSSVFDFEGDGAAEAVYGDECFLRVYEGTTGQVLYSRFRTSCTWYENPVIADTDSDFGAEIIVTSNTNCGTTCPSVDPIFDGVRCFDGSDCPGMTACKRDNAGDAVGFCRCATDADCGGDGFVCLDPIAGPSAEGKVCRAGHPGPATAKGIRVVGDQLGRWVATRPVWNQHAYAVTNVEDSGRIPRTSAWARNWDDPQLNNFRQNSPGLGAGAGLMPDLTVRQTKFSCRGTGEADLTVEVCNRGTEPVADGVAVTVYDGSAPVCTGYTQSLLRPGVCQAVTCAWATPPTTATDLTAVVDDDGTGDGANTECREQNNTLIIAGVACP